MVHQTTVLQELKRPTKRVIKEINSDLIISCNDCRHALLLSHAVYCALRREKISGDTCKGCPHFDLEPLGYRLFRRM
jgi:MinD superfamily P-loop ATPase